MNDPVQTPETEAKTNETKPQATVSSTDIFESLRKLWKRISERQLVIRNREGRNLLQLSLVWAIGITLLTFFFHVLPLLAIVVIVLLLTKHQFIVTHKLEHPNS